MTKITRRICAFFITLSLMITAAPLVFADDRYWQHIKETGTWYRDMYRSAFWSILKLLGEAINYIEEAVKQVLSWNIYTKLTKLDPTFSYNNVKGVALIIVVVAITFAGILLMVNGDKMHIKDSVKNILVALCLIVGMPAIMGALDDFMFGKGDENGYASQVGVSSQNATKEGTVIRLGDRILSMQVYDNIASVKSGKQQTLYSVAYNTKGEEKKDNSNKAIPFISPQDVDINKLADQKDISKKYVSSTVDRAQRKYSELTYENCADLLGMGAEYRKLLTVQDNISLSVKTHTSTSDDSSKSSKSSKSEAEVKTDEYKFYYSFKDGAAKYWTVEQFESHMIEYLKGKTYNEGKIKVSNAKRYNKLISSGNKRITFEQAMEAIKDDIIWQLNYQENSSKSIGNNVDTKTTPLRTKEDYKNLSWVSQIVTVDMWEPNSDERVYAYDYDFFPAFVDMLIVIVCLIFALLKLCRMMWEIAFMHIFVPLVIATDAHGSGRAKRAFQHLISTFAILIVVLITLNLYLTLIGEMHEIENLIARWGLILAGAHFVIDGSDFIVKMTGLDAGVKSGAATLLGLRSAVGMAAGVGHVAASVGSKGAHYGVKAANLGVNAADHAGGAVVGAVAGAVAGAVGGARSGGSEHESAAGTAVGGAVGGATGATAGAVRGGAEGAHRGITGLLGINRNKNNDVQSTSGGTTGGDADGGATSASSGGASSSNSQGASSDTRTAATPPPLDPSGNRSTRNGASSLSSGGASSSNSQGASSDTRTAATPPPIEPSGNRSTRNGASSLSSGGASSSNSQGESSDTGTAATPPSSSTSNSGGTSGSSSTASSNSANGNFDAETATAPDVSSGDSGADTVSAPDVKAAETAEQKQPQLPT